MQAPKSLIQLATIDCLGNKSLYTVDIHVLISCVLPIQDIEAHLSVDKPCSNVTCQRNPET
jgi:hypothetical protein